MKFLTLALLLVLCSCDGDDSNQGGTNTDQNPSQNVELLDLEKLSGSTVFGIAKRFKEFSQNKSEVQKLKLIDKLDDAFFLKCENLRCVIQRKN